MATRGHGRRAGRSLNSEINVTPLVDVMLVVLIIFIVVAPMLQPGVRVDLPPARHLQQLPADRIPMLTVAVQVDGQLYLDSDPIDFAALSAALRSRRLADPRLLLQLKADRDVPYARIQSILSEGRAAGFRGAALVAREAPSTPEVR